MPRVEAAAVENPSYLRDHRSCARLVQYRDSGRTKKDWAIRGASLDRGRKEREEEI